jgi:hypothetical protein
MAPSEHYVFGYGSLVTPGGERIAGLTANVLRGYRRTWNVAMDNTRAIPGYKRYLDPATGTSPPWFVVFLNIVAQAGRYVNGAVFPVSAEELVELDRRERNYGRIEVSSSLAEPVDGIVWTYTGARAAVERFKTGMRAGRAVISQDYEQIVLQGFTALGDDAVREFVAVTDPRPCSVVPLQRVAVPGASGLPASSRSPRDDIF